MEVSFLPTDEPLGLEFSRCRIASILFYNKKALERSAPFFIRRMKKKEGETGRGGEGERALMRKENGKNFGVILKSGLFGKFKEIGYIYCIWI